MRREKRTKGGQSRGHRSQRHHWMHPLHLAEPQTASAQGCPPLQDRGLLLLANTHWLALMSASGDFACHLRPRGIPLRLQLCVCGIVPVPQALSSEPESLHPCHFLPTNHFRTSQAWHVLHNKCTAVTDSKTPGIVAVQQTDMQRETHHTEWCNSASLLGCKRIGHGRSTCCCRAATSLL